MKKINEALGVPDNILKMGERLYAEVLDIIKSSSSFDKLSKETYTVPGGKIGDVDFKSINITFDFDFESNEGYFGKYDLFLYDGMTYKSGKGEIEFYKNNYVKRFEKDDSNINIALEFKIKEVDFELYAESEHLRFFHEYIIEKKSECIEGLTHELMHAYDFYKANIKTLKSRVEYAGILSELHRSNIRPLNELLYMMYYFDRVENSVRPSELAAELKGRGIKQDQFLDNFKTTEIYKFIQRVKNLSFESFMLSLKRYARAFEQMLINSGASDYVVMRIPEEKIIDLGIGILYNKFKDIKSEFMQHLLSDEFGNLSDKERSYFEKYLKNLNKDKDYKDFFKREIQVLKVTADKVLRKLSGIYAYIPLMDEERFDLDDQVRMLAKMVGRGDKGSIELAFEISKGMGIDFVKYVIGRYFKNALERNKLSLDVSGLVQYFEKKKMGMI